MDWSGNELISPSIPPIMLWIGCSFPLSKQALILLSSIICATLFIGYFGLIYRRYTEIFMDMGMLLTGHTLLPLPQFQQLMVRCLVHSITSIQLRIFSLLHQFLLPLKVTYSLLKILKSQQLKQIQPRLLTVFPMVLLTVTVELYPLRRANKIHH